MFVEKVLSGHPSKQQLYLHYLQEAQKKTGYLYQRQVLWSLEEIELGDLQKAICECKYNGLTYEEISKLFDITSPNAIATCLRLTAGSRYWVNGQAGGSHSILTHRMLEGLK